MNNKKTIKIICEGKEEWYYVTKLLSFPFYNKESYCFLEPTNAKGNKNIVAKFQDEYAKNRSDIVLIFCDGDNNSKDFQIIKKQISECV